MKVSWRHSRLFIVSSGWAGCILRAYIYENLADNVDDEVLGCVQVVEGSVFP